MRARGGSWSWMLCACGALALAGCPGESPVPSADAGLDTTPACACDDGRFCNGLESCAPDGTCEAGAAPCASGTPCDEASDTCAMCETDADGDGEPSTACGGLDCDDTDASRFPGAPEICDDDDVDEDCDASTFGARDSDGDGFVDRGCCNGTACGDDCDDTRSNVHPTTTEVCNERDDDCDGGTDEGVRVTFYRDLDGDTFGDDAMTTEECGRPAGFALVGGDCDEGDADRHPLVREQCNAIDDDCDGTVDERAPTDTPCGCTPPASRACGPATDEGACVFGTQTCLDGTWDACAGAVLEMPEECNDADDDCDGSVDEMLTRGCSTACGSGVETCSMGTYGSCSAPAARPEECNGIDDDCDGTADDGVTTRYYRDTDGDGHGVASDFRDGCAPTGAYTSSLADDCNDARAEVYAGHAEICDGIDNDCSSGGGAVAAEDADGDGHTALGYGGCSTGFPIDDCADSRALVFPGAPFRTEPYCTRGPTCQDVNGWSCGSRGGGSSLCNVATIGATLVWDYDCDGVTEREDSHRGCSCIAAPSGVRACSLASAPGFPGISGFNPVLPYYTGTPACGSTVSLASCSGGCTVTPPATCARVTSGTAALGCR